MSCIVHSCMLTCVSVVLSCIVHVHVMCCVRISRMFMSCILVWAGLGLVPINRIRCLWRCRSLRCTTTTGTSATTTWPAQHPPQARRLSCHVTFVRAVMYHYMHDVMCHYIMSCLLCHGIFIRDLASSFHVVAFSCACSRMKS